MRILYVDAESFWRGGQDQLFSLLIGLFQRGHDVCLASPEGPLAQRCRQAGIPHWHFKQRSDLSFPAAARLWRLLGRQRFDVVHFNSPKNLLSGGLALFLRGGCARVASRRVSFPLRSRLSRLKYNRAVQMTVAVSNSIQKGLIDSGIDPARVGTIYEGVDLSRIDGLPAAESVVEENAVSVVTVAQMTAEKGHSWLIRAAAQVLPHFDRLRFVLVGDGPLRSRLQRLTRQLGLDSRFRFLGFRTDADALMKTFDIFCLPSLSEGLSSSILTAMAQALPVVATAVGGTPELVREGETGLLVRPADSGSLAKALRQLVESPAERRQMGQAGRRRIVRDFTLDRKLDNFERLYRELLAAGTVD